MTADKQCGISFKTVLLLIWLFSIALVISGFIFGHWLPVGVLNNWAPWVASIGALLIVFMSRGKTASEIADEWGLGWLAKIFSIIPRRITITVWPSSGGFVAKALTFQADGTSTCEAVGRLILILQAKIKFPIFVDLSNTVDVDALKRFMEAERNKPKGAGKPPEETVERVEPMTPVSNEGAIAAAREDLDVQELASRGFHRPTLEEPPIQKVE
jgi:hypothetical protein